MTLEQIPLEKYKWHQGEGTQYSYKGIALNPKEQVLADKLNEVIRYINGVEAAFGISLDADEKCCQDHSEQAHSDNDAPLDKLVNIEDADGQVDPNYKEDQLKGNEV